MTTPTISKEKSFSGILSPDHCYALLERIGTSAHLKRAPRLREFLDYVGRRAINDHCEHIHEQEIGVQVFGRGQGYDTSADNIVRANATELRKRVEAYFESDGANEPLRMEIPRGSYVPVFFEAPAPSASPLSEVPSPIPVQQPVVEKAFAWRRWLVGGILSALLIVSVALWLELRTLRTTLAPWKHQPHIAALWSEFTSPVRASDIVISDQGFMLAQNLSKHAFTLDEYLNHSYLAQLQAGTRSPEMQYALEVIVRKNMSSLSEIRIGQRIAALDMTASNFRIYSAREFTPPLFARDNVILIGGPMSNPWYQTVSSRLNFYHAIDANRQSPIMNRTPANGEPSSYAAASNPVGYCVVAYLPNPNNPGKLIIIDGTSNEATEAGGAFLLSEAQLSNFLTKIHASSLPYFEVLLQTSQASDTPISSTVVAYRIHAEGN